MSYIYEYRYNSYFSVARECYFWLCCYCIFSKKSLPGIDDFKAAFCLSSLSKSEFNIFPFCGHPSACVLISRVITVYCMWVSLCSIDNYITSCTSKCKEGSNQNNDR